MMNVCSLIFMWFGTFDCHIFKWMFHYLSIFIWKMVFLVVWAIFTPLDTHAHVQPQFQKQMHIFQRSRLTFEESRILVLFFPDSGSVYGFLWRDYELKFIIQRFMHRRWKVFFELFFLLFHLVFVRIEIWTFLQTNCNFSFDVVFILQFE